MTHLRCPRPTGSPKRSTCPRWKLSALQRQLRPGLLPKLNVLQLIVLSALTVAAAPVVLAPALIAIRATRLPPNVNRCVDAAGELRHPVTFRKLGMEDYSTSPGTFRP